MAYNNDFDFDFGKVEKESGVKIPDAVKSGYKSKFLTSDEDNLVISIPKGKVTIPKVLFGATAIATAVLIPVCAYTGLSAIACAVQPQFGIIDTLVYGGVAIGSGKLAHMSYKGAKYNYNKMHGEEESTSKKR